VDTTIPVITILGSNPVTVTLGNTYNDAGATASDNYDGDITANIVTVNNVDTNTVGNYTVTYNVDDSSGNSAIEKVRNVVVEAVLEEVVIGTQTWKIRNLDIDDGLGGIYAYGGNEANVATYSLP